MGSRLIYLSSIIFLLGIFSCENKEVIVSYYPDGTLQTTFMQIDGKRNGLYKQYFPNGNISVRCEYENDTIIGFRERFYENGGLFRREKMKKTQVVWREEYFKTKGIRYSTGLKNGIKDGSFFRMLENGDTAYIATFKNDTCYYEKTFDNGRSGDIVWFYPEIFRTESSLDSINLHIDINSPLANNMLGLLIGRFQGESIGDYEIIDTLAYFSGTGSKLDVTFSKKILINNKITAHLMEYDLDSINTPLITRLVNRDIRDIPIQSPK